MKKYIFLGLCSVIAVIITFQIPNIAEQFADECNTVSVICDTATEGILCKGVIEYLNGKYVARVQISEDDISKVRLGQTVKITCKAVGNRPLMGTVKQLSDTAHQMSYSTFKFTVIDAVIEISEENLKLKSGYTLTAEIIYSKVENATILPFEGVAQDKSGKYYVYRIVEDWAVREYVDIAFETDKGVVLVEKCMFDSVCATPESFSGDFVRIKNVGNN